jgi:sterol desaturase/sphingolipid hydroxylase (fatty acid hydroxylase superfamily)
MAERHYVSKKNETVRMFESDFMEFFSRVHPSTPLLLYMPVVGYMLYLSLWQRKLSILAVAGLFVLGILLWTLLEYLIHRYIFHYEPKSHLGKRLHYIVHGVHHDYPNDARRLVMPPSISVPLAVLFYILFLLIFGHLAQGVFAGLVFGYICYDMLHYATHHFPMKRGFWLWLKQYHLRHHYKDDDAGFGISSPLWDFVFGTTRK